MTATWHDKLKALYLPDLERARELMDARDGVGFVTHVAQWEKCYKRKKSPCWEPYQAMLVAPDWSWPCLRHIGMVAQPEIYESQESFESCMVELQDGPKLCSDMSGRWQAVKGRESEFRGLFSHLLDTSDDAYVSGALRGHRVITAEATAKLAEKAMEFGRLDRVRLLYDKCWAATLGDRDGYPKTPFNVYACIVEGASLWARAREAKDKELARAAKEKFHEAHYHYCHGTPKEHMTVLVRFHWPLAVDWEFQLTPGFDWDGWLANFQYRALRFEPWRSAIREKNLRMPPLDVSWLPPREEIVSISAKYAKK